MDILISSIINHIPSVAAGDSYAWDAEEALDEVKSHYESVSLQGDLKTVYLQIQYGTEGIPGAKRQLTVGGFMKRDGSISAYVPYGKQEIDGLNRTDTVTTVGGGVANALRKIAERIMAKGLKTNLVEHIWDPSSPSS
jgi:predicted glycosyltransferase